MGSQIVQLVRALSGPVLLEEGTLLKLAQVFRRKLAGEEFHGAALHAELGIPAPRARSAGDRQTTIAVIPIQGLIAQHPQSLGTSTDEIGAKIAAARAVKPITALANGLMASAAYWLGSQADEVVVTPSGEVGSIGVYQLHEDWSQNLAQEGIKVRALYAGKYKLEGASW